MAFLSANDRRRSHRHWAAVPIVIRHRGSRIDGVSINIGNGGMYLFAAAHLSLGAQIEIEFRPPDEEQLVCVCGTVRRRALYLYGIEFLADDAAAARGRAVIKADSRMPSLYESESTSEFSAVASAPAFATAHG
ncbi:MAG TPA: PilZ domain-containing protein [Terracidiphilus sp.]